MTTHKWPAAGKSGKCERHGCVTHRHHSKHGKFSFTQGPDGEASTSPGPCTGKVPEKKSEPVDDGLHQWRLSGRVTKACSRRGCNALFDVQTRLYMRHDSERWGTRPGYCKGER